MASELNETLALKHMCSFTPNLLSPTQLWPRTKVSHCGGDKSIALTLTDKSRITVLPLNPTCLNSNIKNVNVLGEVARLSQRLNIGDSPPHSVSGNRLLTDRQSRNYFYIQKVLCWWQYLMCKHSTGGTQCNFTGRRFTEVNLTNLSVLTHVSFVHRHAWHAVPIHTVLWQMAPMYIIHVACST